MPKVKKIRSAALVGQTTRHAPLGQQIQDDEDHGKFAMVGTRTKRNRRGDENMDELYDEKTSRRILELGREQQMEMEREEEEQARRNRVSEGNARRQHEAAMDSSDEEEEEESVLLQDDDAE